MHNRPALRMCPSCRLELSIFDCFVHLIIHLCSFDQYCAALCCAVLRCAALRCAVLCCAVLRCAALRCAVLCCA